MDLQEQPLRLNQLPRDNLHYIFGFLPLFFLYRLLFVSRRFRQCILHHFADAWRLKFPWLKMISLPQTVKLRRRVPKCKYHDWSTISPFEVGFLPNRLASGGYLLDLWTGDTLRIRMPPMEVVSLSMGTNTNYSKLELCPIHNLNREFLDWYSQICYIARSVGILAIDVPKLGNILVRLLLATFDSIAAFIPGRVIQGLELSFSGYNRFGPDLHTWTWDLASPQLREHSIRRMREIREVAESLEQSRQRILHSGAMPRGLGPGRQSMFDPTDY